jgi:methylenetetrahydrofolate dehydrogenase (NADP+) / methenyltetrahydrofolate cyclohydrolase
MNSFKISYYLLIKETLYQDVLTIFTWLFIKKMFSYYKWILFNLPNIMIKLSGQKISCHIQEKLQEYIVKQKTKPSLSIFYEPTEITTKYIHAKQKYAQDIGAFCKLIPLQGTQKDVQDILTEANQDQNTHGIIIQLPHTQFDTFTLTSYINPQKDIDGLHYQSLGKCMYRQHQYNTCTNLGVVELLKAYHLDQYEGKNIVIIGDSPLIGRSLGLFFLDQNATVHICNKHTPDLLSLIKQGDIVISAVGKKHLFSLCDMKKDSIAINIGFSYEDNKIYGDIDVSNPPKHIKAYTPILSSTGPMTIAILFHKLVQNTYTNFPPFSNLMDGFSDEIL